MGRLRQEMRVALSAAVCAAQAYVQSQPRLPSAATSFPQGQQDGQKPQGSQGWLWVLVTPLMRFFEVVLSRSQATAKALMGETFAGMSHADRYSASHWIELAQWPVCWAHLKRDLSAIAQRSGGAQTIGESLLRRQRRLFRWWYQVRDGTLARPQCSQRVHHLRTGFNAELAAASALPIEQQEQTPFAQTVRTCRRLLKIEPAFWTFGDHAGVEPTNHAAERALRPAVIWRRTSFGAPSRSGTQFVARMLTVSASLKAQNRNILDCLTHSIHAARSGLTAPSLLPQPSAEEKLLFPTQKAV